MPKYSEFLKVAVDASFKSGEILKEGFYKNFEKNLDYELKGFADPVTEYDKKSESIIVDIISSKFPSSTFLAEEKGEIVSTNSSLRWIIDPLDGTVNFIHSIPYIAISIALEIEGEITVGVIYNPVIDELFTAIKEEGSFMNNKRIRVSSISDPGSALIVTGFPYKREGRVNELLKPLRVFIKDYQGFRRLGAASIDLAYVARGSFEAFYEENLKPWDTAAGKLIVEEAGGKVTDYYGNEFNIYSKSILASNGLIHNHIIEVLKDVQL